MAKNRKTRRSEEAQEGSGDIAKDENMQAAEETGNPEGGVLAILDIDGDFGTCFAFAKQYRQAMRPAITNLNRDGDELFPNSGERKDGGVVRPVVSCTTIEQFQAAVDAIHNHWDTLPEGYEQARGLVGRLVEELLSAEERNKFTDFSVNRSEVKDVQSALRTLRKKAEKAKEEVDGKDVCLSARAAIDSLHQAVEEAVKGSFLYNARRDGVSEEEIEATVAKIERFPLTTLRRKMWADAKYLLRERIQEDRALSDLPPAPQRPEQRPENRGRYGTHGNRRGFGNRNRQHGSY